LCLFCSCLCFYICFLHSCIYLTYLLFEPLFYIIFFYLILRLFDASFQFFQFSLSIAFSQPHTSCRQVFKLTANGVL
jgi:hypothetical protein